MTIKERQQAIIDEFNAFDDWEDRYLRIIEIGKDLPDLPKEKQDEDHRVKGCQSRVWLHASLNDEGHIVYEADSDAMIVRGLVALLLKVYSDAPPEEVVAAKPDFLEEAGFSTHLSPSRSNGLYSMVEQIKYYALAFNNILKARQ